jgi:Tfp pilus assembly protein FimT
MKKYFPYKSDRPDKKYFIITNDNKKIYFGQASASDFTLHKDEARKQRYINRHKKNENWNNKDTAGFWSRWLLWEKPTIKESYDNIKKKINI